MASSLRTDRRFAPIYAAIEEYDYRNAVKLAEKREIAGHPLAKVRGVQGRREG
jgi:hypothetical protein